MSQDQNKSGSEQVDKLETLLSVFDIGLSFALCHKDFNATREAIKKLQIDFLEICKTIENQNFGEPVATAKVSAGYVLVPRAIPDDVRTVIQDINSDSGEGWKPADEESYWNDLLKAAVNTQLTDEKGEA